MDHVKNVVRIGVIFFWITYAALIWALLKNSGNLHAVGTGTFLLYGFTFVVVTYVAVVLTPKLWSTK